MLPSPSTTRTQEYPAVAPLKEFLLGSGLSWDLRKDGHPPKGQVVTEDWCSSFKSSLTGSGPVLLSNHFVMQ